ncbi:metal-dependent hydrolase domain protein, partial [Vibrio parahaemolyticus VP2007-007]
QAISQSTPKPSRH